MKNWMWLMAVAGALCVGILIGDTEQPEIIEWVQKMKPPTPPPSTTQATIPEKNVKKFISTMKVGEEGFTQVEAMVVNQQNKAWLHPHFEVRQRHKGNNQLYVRRLPTGGFEVVNYHYRYQWEPIHVNPKSGIPVMSFENYHIN